MGGGTAPSLERDVATALATLSRECARSSGGLLTSGMGWLVGSTQQHATLLAAVATAEAALQKRAGQSSAAPELEEVRRRLGRGGDRKAGTV